jgi:hypothetical protein
MSEKSKNSLLFIILIFSVFQSCKLKEEPSTPKSNFELLWKIVDENYCYLDYKRINWDSIKIVYEPRVKNITTDKELFDLFSAMLAELKDGHVSLSSNFNTFYYNEWYLDYPPNFNFNLLERRYLGYDYALLNGLIFDKYNNVGYMRCGSFMDRFNINDIRSGISNLGKLDGLIIDVRDNTGGYIDLAETMAAAFITGRTTVGYTKYKEGPGHSQFSDFFPKTIEGASPVVYEGKIIILTNRMVYSSGNDFVNNIKNRSNLDVLGDKTGGGGGAPFSSELYNGWQLRLSRNPLFDVNKKDIEGGIEPDIYLNMDKSEEFNGIDTILEEAIFKLSGKYYNK